MLRRGQRVRRGRLPPPLPSGEPLARPAAPTSAIGPSVPPFPSGSKNPLPGSAVTSAAPPPPQRSLNGPSTAAPRARARPPPRKSCAASGDAGGCRRLRAGGVSASKATPKASFFLQPAPRGPGGRGYGSRSAPWQGGPARPLSEGRAGKARSSARRCLTRGHRAGNAPARRSRAASARPRRAPAPGSPGGTCGAGLPGGGGAARRAAARGRGSPPPAAG